MWLCYIAADVRVRTAIMRYSRHRPTASVAYVRISQWSMGSLYLRIYSVRQKLYRASSFPFSSVTLLCARVNNAAQSVDCGGWCCQESVAVESREVDDVLWTRSSEFFRIIEAEKKKLLVRGESIVVPVDEVVCLSVRLCLSLSVSVYLSVC